MKELLINQIVREMLPSLNNAQMGQLQKVLEKAFNMYDVIENRGAESEGKQTNEKLICNDFCQ